MAPKAFMSWSSGKDSAFALHEARKSGDVEIVGLLTTVNEEYERVAMHGVREELLDMQAEALGLPLLKVRLPNPCTNETYEARMEEACAEILRQGVRHMVFGDLFLEDVRQYREDRLKPVGIGAVFPLWQRDTRELAQDMIESGLVAHLTCLDPRKISAEFAGRRFDARLLAELPETVDPCGENGEYHTIVTEGPMFSRALPVAVGETVTREGFVFTDILPVAA